MKISELPSYQEIIQYLAKKNRQKHLLFGNGFSIAYDSEIFSYNALSKFIDEIDNDLLRKLFQVIDNKNFEYRKGAFFNRGMPRLKKAKTPVSLCTICCRSCVGIVADYCVPLFAKSCVFLFTDYTNKQL